MSDQPPCCSCQATLKLTPQATLKLTPSWTFVKEGIWTNVDADLVNLLDTQADQSDVTNVHLRSTQEDTRMLEPEVVDRIHELSGQGLGSKRIARQLGISRNSVRRYLAGATVGFQERPAARRLDGATLREVHRLFGTVAEGNTVVIQQELASRGIQIDLRTLQRAVATLRQEERARSWPQSGSRPRRANRSKSTSVKRSSGSPVSPSRFI